MLIPRLAAWQAALWLAALPVADATAGQRTVTDAVCRPGAVWIFYSDGRTSTIRLDAADGHTCEDLRISRDRTRVGWLREGPAESDAALGGARASDLFVDGRVVAPFDEYLFIYGTGWRFSSDGTKVLFCAGSAYGGCTFYVVDIATKRPLKACDQRQKPDDCLDWERLFESEHPDVDLSRLTGVRPRRAAQRHRHNPKRPRVSGRASRGPTWSRAGSAATDRLRSSRPPGRGR